MTFRVKKKLKVLAHHVPARAGSPLRKNTPPDIMSYEDATNEVTLCRYVTGGQSCLEWAINLYSACCGVSSRCLCILTHPLRSGRDTDLGYYTSTPPSHIQQEHLRDDNAGRIGRQTPATKTTRDTCGLIWTGGGRIMRQIFFLLAFWHEAQCLQVFKLFCLLKKALDVAVEWTFLKFFSGGLFTKCSLKYRNDVSHLLLLLKPLYLVKSKNKKTTWYRHFLLAVVQWPAL